MTMTRALAAATLLLAVPAQAQTAYDVHPPAGEATREADSSESEKQAKWGFFAQLIGGGWSKGRDYEVFAWSDDGATLSRTIFSDRRLVQEDKLVFNEQTGAIDWVDLATGKVWKTSFLQTDGSFFSVERRHRQYTYRTKLLPDGRVREDAGRLSNGTFRPKDGWTGYMTRLTEPEYLAQLDAIVRAERAAKTAEGGGLFGTLLGAAVGGVAAVAGGADAATAASLAMQGAAVTSGNAQMATAMAKGSAEVSASNAQMEAQLQGSINRGLAQGNAQYRAAQGSNAGQQGASSSGIEVQTAEAAPAPAFTAAATPTPAPAPAAPKMLYWRCMAAKGGTTTIYSSTFGVPSGSHWNMMTLRSAYDQFLRGQGSGFLRDVNCRSATTMAEAETLSSFNTTGQTIETIAWSPQ